MARLSEIDVEVEFAPQEVKRWRAMVSVEREALFRRNWKNRKQVVPLSSREYEMSFQSLVEWCEEFNDVVGRKREKSRMDKLIALGLDVNAPHDPSVHQL